MKILLATDGSSYSKIAVEELAEWVHNPHTEIRIVSVYESFPLTMIGPAPVIAGGGYYEEAAASARKAVERAVKEAYHFLKEKNSDLSISEKVIDGSPKEAILKEADEFNADLIVVGSHGRGAFSRFLLGSVSQSMALHANCSVLIVRKPGVNKEEK